MHVAPVAPKRAITRRVTVAERVPAAPRGNLLPPLLLIAMLLRPRPRACQEQERQKR